MPLGQLYERYVTQGLLLRQYDQQLATAVLSNGQRPWMVPDLGLGSWGLPGLALAYDRMALGEAYAVILTDKRGTDGDAMAVKLQSDYLAAQERAYRLQLLGPVRAQMHAAARRQAHGNDSVGVFARVDSYVQDLIMAGAAGFSEG